MNSLTRRPSTAIFNCHLNIRQLPDARCSYRIESVSKSQTQERGSLAPAWAPAFFVIRCSPYCRITSSSHYFCPDTRLLWALVFWPTPGHKKRMAPYPNRGPLLYVALTRGFLGVEALTAAWADHPFEVHAPESHAIQSHGRTCGRY